MADGSLLGRVLWYELMTTDMGEGEKFYTGVVGWTVAPFEVHRTRTTWCSVPMACRWPA